MAAGSRRRSPGLVGALLLLTGTLLGAATAIAGSGQSAAVAGAYCPLPEPGQTPACLTPARATYGDFFAAIGRGDVPAGEAAAVEADLTGGSGTERAYLALSSLSYGYYRLAERLRAQPDGDPVLQARLDHWNQLLVAIYGSQASDPRFRAAMRQAAHDLHRRAAADVTACPNRYPGGCEHSEQLVRALSAIDDTAGVRSPLGHLVRRLFGGGSDEAAIEAGDGP